MGTGQEIARGSGAAARTCGSCTGCCYVGGVTSLGKPAYQTCTHASTKGCAIYSTRPQECRDYACLWIEGEFADGDRPDQIGLMFDLPKAIEQHPDYEGIQVICARELWTNARDEPRAATLLMQLSQSFVIRMTRDGGGTQLMGPQGLIETLLERAAARERGS